MLSLLALASPSPSPSPTVACSAWRRRRVADATVLEVLWLTPALMPVMRMEVSGTRSATDVPLEKSCCAAASKLTAV
jgi:hypothetical protein